MIKIDENRLIQELYYQRNAFKYGINDIIKNDYGSYNFLNGLLANLTGKMFHTDGVFYNPKESKLMFEKHYSKQVNKFINITNEYEEYFLIMLSNFVSILEANEFNCIDYINKVRKYSEKDFIDIIYSYFSTYGNKVYSIVKRYFEEERIQMGYDFISDTDYAGFFSKLIYINGGYIVSLYSRYDSRSLCNISHELGHAIDAEMFHFPQQKVITTVSDIYSEISSTMFELGMYDYLKKNRIDDRGALLLYNNRFQMLKSNYEELKEVSDAEEAYVQDDGNAVVTKEVTYDLSELNQDEDGNIIVGDYTIPKDKLDFDENGRVKARQYILYPFRDDIVYSNGYYMALHLNLIKEQGMKEFLKIFNNIITSRKEASFEDIVEKTGLTVDEYISGEFIKDKVQDEILTLKRRYKVY